MPGVTVEVHGISPADRDLGRLAELRCAIRAISNGIDAERHGYDAFVIGHFQDPGLYELRSALSIPVIGVGEATLFAAAQLGRRLGLVTLDPVFEVWHLEQVRALRARRTRDARRGIGLRAQRFQRRFRR
jgi:Asp/Glu/hydantoin racemase